MTCNNCIHFGVCRLENETPARCQHFMPNIVHCKDCKHRSEKNCFHPQQEFGFESIGGECLSVNDTDFCSYGEKP